jgi:hypothetical protein
MVRTRTALVGVVVSWLVCLEPVFAISPSYIMAYGGDRSGPLTIRVGNDVRTSFLWETRIRREGTIERGSLAGRLSGRAFVKFAIFWGHWDDVPTAPDEASQHGRFYLPTPSEPAVIVVTSPVMEEVGVRHPAARPIPVDFEDRADAHGDRIGFVAGWTLSAEDLAQARSLFGLPGS